jgi:glycosyltransferase involved in cell wall biosynthesis
MTVGLLSTRYYEHLPTIISVDATPLNLDELAGAYQHKRLPAPIERAKLVVTRNALQPARGFVAWCEWAKRSLIDDYGIDGDKVHVIAPGTDLQLFRASARDGGGMPRILFVGGDFIRKGGDVLLEAYRNRLKGKAELHIVTISDVRDEEGVYVHKGLKANSEELLGLFRTCDIFALPTRADCLAMVLGEAMAASLPIVTTAVGGHSEAVIDHETGYVIRPDDPAALGCALEALVDNPVLRRQMGQSSRQLAEEKFDARRNAERVLDLLRQIA